MKVNILFFRLHDLYYVNIKKEKFGDLIEIIPHWKIGLQLLCGRMDAVMKNLFFNFKIRTVSSAQGQFLMWFLEKYKGANFHEDWPYRTQNFKMAEFLKKRP